MDSGKSALIYGGAGQLGTEAVKAFKAAGWTVTSVDFRKNDIAQQSLLIHGDVAKDTHELLSHLKGQRFDAVICVAGGWQGGNAAADDIFASVDKMYRFNVLSSVSAVHVATKTLKEHGTVVLFGAAAALQPTPGMLAYGLSKAATHHLIQSVAQPNGGLPTGAVICGLCPVTLDTATNRADMPTANFTNWTPLPVVAETLVKWACGAPHRPQNGQLVKIITREGVTHTEPVPVG